MVQFIDRQPTFVEQFTSGLAAPSQQGIQNIPQMAMMLAGMRRDRESQALQQSRPLVDEALKGSSLKSKTAFVTEAAKLASQGKTPAEIEAYLADRLTDQQNKLSRLENVHDAPSLWNNIKNFISEGRIPTEEEIIREATIASQGLDPVEARRILSEKGFTPNMREKAIGKINMDQQKIISELPVERNIWSSVKAGKGVFGNEPTRAEGERKEAIFSNVSKVLKQNPNANLIALRSEYEKRGVDWRDFNEAIQELIISGELVPDDEQQAMINNLNRPPLDRLEKMLRTFGLVK